MTDRCKRKMSPGLPGAANSAKRAKNHSDEESLHAFQRLLDFSDLLDPTSIRQRFDDIGSALLRDFLIVVQTRLRSDEPDFVETKLQTMEIEFYFWNSTCHRDPFTHGSQEQRRAGQWYFHRTPRRSDDSTQNLISTSGYRGGTRKGLDLSISGGVTPTKSPYFPSSSQPDEQEAYGGVLLRTLRDLNSGKIISGPSLLADHILLLSGAERISDLVQDHWGNDINAFKSLHVGERKAHMFLCPAPIADPRPHIYKSPRIGLDLSHPGTTASPTHPRVEFISQPYRYFVNPEKLTANGRAQTLLGVLPHKELSGLKDKTLNAYMSEYQTGLDGKAKLEEFVGARGKGISSSPTKYIKLMGCIEALKAVKCDDNGRGNRFVKDNENQAT